MSKPSSNPRAPATLFNPARQKALQRHGRRLMLGLAAGGAVIFAVVFWFVAENVWLSLGLFAGVFVLMAGTGLLVTWKPSPSVTCHGCGGQGWIDDLTGAGACPRCGGTDFRFYRYQGRRDPVQAERIAGAELKDRRAKIGMPWY